MPAHFIALDRELKILFANRLVRELVAGSHGDIIGQSYWSVWPQAKGTTVEEAIQQAVVSRERVCFSFNDTNISLEGSVQVIQDVISIFFTDISAKDKAEAEFSRMSNFVTDCFLDLDMDCRIVRMNTAAERFFQVDSKVARGQIVWEALPALADPGFHDICLMLQGDRQPMVREAQQKNERWIEVKAFPHDGGVTLFLCDVTDRHEAEETLRAATDAAPVLISYLDATLTYLFVNRQYEDLYRRPRSEIIGRSIHSLIGDEAFGVVKPYLESALAGTEASYEKWLPYADAGPRFVRATYTPRVNSNGQVVGVFVLVVDLTRQRLAEEALLAEERRQRLLGQLSEFARTSTSPRELVQEACRLTSEALGVNRSLYAIVRDDQILIEHDYVVGVPSMVGAYPLSGIGEPHLQLYQREQPVIVTDAKLEQTTKDDWSRTLEPLSIRSFVTIPIVRESKFVACFSVQSNQPRIWTHEEVELVNSIGARMCDAIERIRAERELKESEQRLRALFDNAMVGVCEMDLETFTYVRVNPAFAKMLGYEPEELIGLSPIQLAYKEDQQVGSAEIEQMKRGVRSSATWVRRFLRKDGKVVWLLVGLTRFTGHGDPKGRMMGVYTDISDQKEHERSIRESEHRFRAIAEQAPLFVWEADADGRVVYRNGRFRDFLGMEACQSSGAWWSANIHPDDQKALEEKWVNAVAQGFEFNHEFRIKQPDGAYRWLRSQALPISSDEDENRLWVGVATDVQRDHEYAAELERQVRERTAELEAAYREQESFSYSVSHDLRAPLRAIVSTSRILEDDHGDSLPPSALAALRRQSDAAKRLAHLIDDLLQLSRVGRQELTRTKLNMSHLFNSAAEILEPINGVSIEVQAGMTAWGDERLIRLVAQNLLENASKFSLTGGVVKVGRDTTREGKPFFVSDEGVGFSMDYAHKLFQPFQRLHREDEFSGTGIGLATVRRIVERHGGTVSAYSEPGRGATFYFTLPKG